MGGKSIKVLFPDGNTIILPITQILSDRIRSESNTNIVDLCVGEDIEIQIKNKY